MNFCFPDRRGYACPPAFRPPCPSCTPCPFPCFPCPLPCPPPCGSVGGALRYDVVTFAPFTPVKRDRQTGAALAGAAYAIYQNGARIAETVSDASGRLNFVHLAPGLYELRETAAPAGYQPDDNVYAVAADQNGNVTVNGLPADEFVLYDTAFDAFAFSKTDAETGGPLAGASFRLSDGRTAVSDAAGLVSFGTLTPGNYTMTETAAPDGYAPNPAVYNVVAAANGNVTVDAIPLSEFSVGNTPLPVSPVPTVETLFQGDTAVVGRGIPGASIRMTLPDGTGVTTTVNANEIWVAAVPAGIDLSAGQTVRFRQSVTGFLPSPEVSVIVQART